MFCLASSVYCAYPRTVTTTNSGTLRIWSAPLKARIAVAWIYKVPFGSRRNSLRTPTSDISMAALIISWHFRYLHLFHVYTQLAHATSDTPSNGRLYRVPWSAHPIPQMGGCGHCKSVSTVRVLARETAQQSAKEGWCAS